MARTLDSRQVAQIAAAHEEARLEARPMDPVTRSHPELTLDDAYAIQAAWIELQVGNGAKVLGHKIGLTSRAMQMAMKIDEPDFGALLDYMFIPNGGSITAAKYLDPMIEVEFAFILQDDLVPHGREQELTSDDVYAATDRIVPSLELIDARSYRVHPDDGRTRTVLDTISDNAANAGIIVGAEAFSVEDARRGSLKWAGAICSRNGIVEETGLGAAVLGDPVMGIVWLANRMEQIGIPLTAGQTILAGSFTRPVRCRAGDHFVVDFGNLGVLELDVV